MKKQVKIFFFLIPFIFTGLTGLAQSNVIQVDSVTLNQNKSESSADKKDKNTKENLNKKQENIQKSGSTPEIKQVKGARPDMSKTRGARPAYIERQAGRGIPRGIGKPGGAIKPGKR